MSIVTHHILVIKSSLRWMNPRLIQKHSTLSSVTRVALNWMSSTSINVNNYQFYGNRSISFRCFRRTIFTNKLPIIVQSIVAIIGIDLQC